MLFAELPLPPYVVDDLNRAKVLDNTARLWKENKITTETTCLSETDRCSSRPEIVCGKYENDCDCDKYIYEWNFTYIPVKMILAHVHWMVHVTIEMIRNWVLLSSNMDGCYLLYMKIVRNIFLYHVTYSMKSFGFFFSAAVNTIRLSHKSKEELPSPRIIGNVLHQEERKRDNHPLFWSYRDDKPIEGRVINFLGFMMAQIFTHDIGNRIASKRRGEYNKSSNANTHAKLIHVCICVNNAKSRSYSIWLRMLSQCQRNWHG